MLPLRFKYRSDLIWPEPSDRMGSERAGLVPDSRNCWPANWPILNRGSELNAAPTLRADADIWRHCP